MLSPRNCVLVLLEDALIWKNELLHKARTKKLVCNV